MTCVPYTQWIAANAACNAKSNPISVKGFGYVPTGRAALRGLGFSVSASITPTSVANAIQSGQLINPPSSSAPPVVQSTPSINTTPMLDPSDPCFVATQEPCPAGQGCPAVCPPGFHSIDLVARPGQPAMCNCTRDRAPAPNYGNAFMARGTPNTPPRATIPAGIQANASASGGFQHWGILAAVVLGGGALYYVTKKKKAA